MAIPDFQSIMLPFLQRIADGKEYMQKDIVEDLADMFGLTDEERQVLNKGSSQTTFGNRTAWAKLYLKRAGLIEQPRRGVFTITGTGRTLLADPPGKITKKYLKRYPSFEESIDGRTAAKTETPISEDAETPETTPDETIQDAFDILNNALADELLDQLKTSSPAFFERIVVELLVAMGYGGSIEDAGEAIGKSHDGGIDGIINEDKLGLDIVVVQAKRWDSNTVGRPDVQGFAGSMEGRRAKKGVFITTSSFSKEAHEFVKHIERRIVLIDGTALANLMIDNGVSVTTYRSFVLKKVDADYFEE